MHIEFTSHDDLPVPKTVHQRLLDHAQLAHPHECCGLLLGAAGRITIAQECANVHKSPRSHFEIDPRALINAYRAERDGGPKIIGYYHSHPVGAPFPSQTDRAMAAGDGKIWAIVGEDKVLFWRDGGSRFEPLSYQVVER